MFRIKICGVTSVEDAQMVAAAGADAIGLNFFAGSPRGLTIERAQPIADALRGRVSLVGVFVNHAVETIQQTVDKLSLDYVQLHGDEPLEWLVELADLRIIRAFRVDRESMANVSDYLRRAAQQQILLDAALIDAHDPQHYGGTGKTADWHALRDARHSFGGLPLVLAGGLRPENVARAISLTRPDAVDTASGVELAAGKKSADQVARFVDAATDAFEKLSRY